MRSEQEVLELILRTAREDDRIRAALLVGSRANPAIAKDDYQDFDVIYLVKDVQSLLDDDGWIDRIFGKPAIMQTPDSMELCPCAQEGHFSFLMIFEDGIRIDLSLDESLRSVGQEPTVKLLDRDGTLPEIPMPDGTAWNVKPPSERLFGDCCNEFWWCLNNVGKGLARDEIPYAMDMLNSYVRAMLDVMLSWHVGVNTGFSVSTGKAGKYFKKHLPEEMYSTYLQTYPEASKEQIWVSVEVACDLFRTAALQVASKCGFLYNQGEEDAMRAFLSRIRSSDARCGGKQKSIPEGR